MIKDFILLPLKEMRRRKLRSWLTLIGVIIGMAAVVSLITLGQGLENAIADQFDALGNDKLFITAKGNSLTPGLSIDAVKITQKDLDVVRSTSGIKEATGLIFSTARVEFNDNVRYFFVSGMPTELEERKLIGESQSYHLLKGRWLESGDNFKAVAGFLYTEDNLFGKEADLGDKILIQDTSFKLVGFWERIGSPPDDQSISIPIDAYQEIFNKPDEFGLLIAQTNTGDDPEKVAAQVEKELRKSRNVEEGKEDFSIETPAELAETFSTILNIVQWVLIGIAGISLFVGGIGIMNTMYTAVLQRTKQIGVLKALGAQRKHILTLFLIESGFYGLGGGLIGVAIGLFFAKMVEFALVAAIGPAFLSLEINLWLIVGTLIFSFVVGCLSGIAPARRASRLNPVDSLRYE
ncbi:ABC transporter permease [Candidatus Woesearchaeota archaeon]|jgi:putative ABC transport system permease protein|nr:ABC transporter permease [Candidatus Woesearchaeota archaeon]MBT5740636.1 ABC transporter permease [Candidatus Woesearchaeota archaeon]MBT6402486.1 ABC transporter permease [Candidatus Woesearchaeota archaeon]